MTAPSTTAAPTPAATPVVARRPRRRPSRLVPDVEVLALRGQALLQALRAQPLSAWCTLAYVMFEYVRPQQIYEWMAVLPWGNLTLSGAVLFTVLEGRYKGIPHLIPGVLGGFTAIVLASSVLAYQPATSFGALDLLGQWLLVIFVLGGMGETRLRLVLLFSGFLLWNLKMSQSAVRSWASDGFAFREWGMSGAPGWFDNSGEFGIAMCVFFPMVVYYLIGLWPRLSPWKRAALGAVAVSAVIGMVGSSSRGAVLGGGAVAAWAVLRSRHRVRVGVAMGLLAALAWGLLPEASLNRWRGAGSDETSTKRLTYWRHGIEIAREHPVLGVGYKNWMPYYAAYYNPKGQLPHNIFIEALGELGYLGLAGFVALIVATFVQNARTRRLTGPDARAPDRFVHAMAYGLDGALVGYLTSGFFVTVLFYPYFWFNLGFTLALARYAVVRQEPPVDAPSAAALAPLGPPPAPGARGLLRGAPVAIPRGEGRSARPQRPGQRGGLAAPR
jgi:putative inorganic carbon (HCO3(-)) transporter